MILWVDGAHDPAENMRRDARLLEAAGRGVPGEPVLRLFAFAPRGLTLGHGQRAERELDLVRCRARGLTWARRPTGGRAILHVEEWTYSLAAPIDDPHWGGSLADAYARVSDLIAASLQSLGVPCTIAGRTRGAPSAGAPSEAALPCFASTARHEIVIEGRKCVGSAQRRTAHALLQQGSVLLGEGHLDIAEVLAIPDTQRAGTRARLAAASTDCGAWIPPATPLARWADAIASHVPATRIASEADLTQGWEPAAAREFRDGPRSDGWSGRPAGSG